MMNAANFRYSSSDTELMGTLGTDDPLPKRVVGFRLSITLDDKGEVNISYTEAWQFELTVGQTIKDVMAGYAKEPDKSYGSKPVEPYPSRGNSNLSIRHKDFSYLVFILGNKNAQFYEGEEPFEVEKNNSAYYSDPLCAWISAGTVTFDRNPGPKSRVASFVANSAADQAASTQSFFTNFNIYLQLRLPRQDDPTQVRMLPIVIDPDVGHPGGSQP